MMNRKPASSMQAGAMQAQQAAMARQKPASSPSATANAANMAKAMAARKPKATPSGKAPAKGSLNPLKQRLTKKGMAYGGMAKKGMNKGGMANCGASMKPAQGKGK